MRSIMKKGNFLEKLKVLLTQFFMWCSVSLRLAKLKSTLNKLSLDTLGSFWCQIEHHQSIIHCVCCIKVCSCYNQFINNLSEYYAKEIQSWLAWQHSHRRPNKFTVSRQKKDQNDLYTKPIWMSTERYALECLTYTSHVH